MRVIRSDGTIIKPMNKAAIEEQNLKDVWASLEQKGHPHPMKSGLRGVRPMRRKSTDDT